MKITRKVESYGSVRISVLLLVSGILSLVFSIYAENQASAFIGLGLTFWGILFLLIKPTNLVDGSLLCNSALSTYLTVERIINEFNSKGASYYIAPYPADVYLPEYLRGLKDAVVFISSGENKSAPSIEELAKGKFLPQNSKGVLITPPGIGILTQIEEKLKVDFTKIALDELKEVLPRIILQDLNLAKELNLELENDEAHLKIIDSLYKSLYNTRSDLKSINLLGCPIASAVACALAKASGKTVTLKKYLVFQTGTAVEAEYQIMRD